MKVRWLAILLVMTLAGCGTKVTGEPDITNIEPGESLNEAVKAEEDRGIGTRTDITTVIENIGQAVSRSGYKLEGPMETAIRRNVDDLDLYERGEGYWIRTSAEDTEVMKAVEAVDEELVGMGFAKTAAVPKNSASLVREFSKYVINEVTCVYEKRAIGTTGQVDVAIGCYE